MSVSRGSMALASMRVARLFSHGTPRSIPKQQLRRLTLQGYQSQNLLREYGVPVSQVSSPQTRVIPPRDNMASITDYPLRTGPSGKDAMVDQSTASDEKWYLAMGIDRELYSPVIIISRRGGENIQTIASEFPDSVISFPFSLSRGITSELMATISTRLETSPTQSTNLENILTNLHKIFSGKEATLLEINPLSLSPPSSSSSSSSNGVFTSQHSIFSFDDDAAHRQPSIFSLRDKTQEIPDEVEAEKFNLVYVKMGGNIGNIVNGAGLAMATNDAIGMHGGRSANFLDAGGQATKETMMQAMGIVLRDERVRAVLINIYGGITRCDMIAESIIGAAKEIHLSVPIVVRLQGTNSAKGLKLLADADLGLHVESDFGRAALRAVELAG